MDGPAASAMMVYDITTLAHEPWNNSVKRGALVSKFFLSSAQSMNVFCCLWKFFCKQLKGDKTQGLTIGCCVREHGGVKLGYSLARAQPHLQSQPLLLLSIRIGT